MKEKIKELINIENILCFFIIICPILDVISFIFRNTFNTNISPSTVIRPIIPASVIIYLFFKKDNKFRKYCFLILGIYAIYSIIHLYCFYKIKTESSYGTIIREAQYLVNYSFMILNLFIYAHIFKNKNANKLKKSVMFAVYIYIISIYLSILTGTSSYTYSEEKIGLKGWIESGNSVSAIFTLTMFIYLNYFSYNKYKKSIAILLLLVGFFLTFLIGTRVGLIGFWLILILYFIIETLYSIFNKKNINKKMLLFILAVMLISITIVAIFGSKTLQRRKYLKEIENNILDESTNQNSHITGDLLEIKNKIDSNSLEENYMNEAQKQSILDLYRVANQLNISNNDQRMQQLIYNVFLIKNQKSIGLIAFGNGYLANFRELVLEMELPAFLFNFGIIGFILYITPFLTIFIYTLIFAIKNIKKIDVEYIMLEMGCGFTFVLSLLSGYTFFNSSTMIIIVVLNALIINKMYRIRGENEKNSNWNNKSYTRWRRKSVSGLSKQTM